MSVHLEIERKFLVKFPNSWIQLSDLFDTLVDVKRISQSYLSPKPGEQAGRVRKTVSGLTGDTDTTYDYNRKAPKGTGVHKEIEHKINQSQYEKFLQHTDPDKSVVDKTRFVFEYNDQTFELDVFRGPLHGLAILEIELEDKNDKVELPPFLRIYKEVTEDKRYSNFSLADKKYHKK